MRIVEYEKNTTSVTYRWLNGVAIAAATISFAILFLMIGNHLLVKRADPIHSPALLKLTEQLKSESHNVAMKEEIRELDFLARHAFFSSQRFQAVSIYLLLIALTVTVVAYRSLQTYRARAPYPLGNPPKEDLADNARWARNAIGAAGLFLVGLALALAIPWSSPLDSATKIPTKAAVVPAAGMRPTKEEFAKNWPWFLGAANSRVAATQLPTKWDGATGEGVSWKLAFPKNGLGSPIVWNNRVFVSGGDADRREVYCVDAESGKLLWTHVATGIAGSPTETPNVPEETTMAASTMATDGERVFAIFATGDLLALDFEGRRVWARNLGVPDNPFGHGSSLALREEALFVQYDQRTNGLFLAIDTKSGETKWKVSRAFEPSWATPLVTEIAGKSQVILAAAPAVASYDPNTGAELWRVAFFGKSEVAPTPVFADGLLYVSAEGAGLAAIDVAKKAVVWNEKELAPSVATGLVVGDLWFCGLDDGGIVCRNAKTGAKIWETETDDGFYASPLLCGDRIYLTDRAGLTYIFNATNKFSLIAKCKLGEEVSATPAVYGNSLLIRGKKNLYRIGS